MYLANIPLVCVFPGRWDAERMLYVLQRTGAFRQNFCFKLKLQLIKFIIIIERICVREKYTRIHNKLCSVSRL